MKNIWKALGITAVVTAAASLIPYRVRKDKDEDVTTVDALLWQATRSPGEGEEKARVDVNLGFKSPLKAAREEQALFADDEPEAAVVEAIADEAKALAEEAEAKAEEIEKKAEAFEAQAEEAAEPTATEKDFEPEL